MKIANRSRWIRTQRVRDDYIYLTNDDGSIEFCKPSYKDYPRVPIWFNRAPSEEKNDV